MTSTNLEASNKSKWCPKCSRFFKNGTAYNSHLGAKKGPKRACKVLWRDVLKKNIGFAKRLCEAYSHPKHQEADQLINLLSGDKPDAGADGDSNGGGN